MTNPFAVLLFQAINSYNNNAALLATPAKQTLPKALFYTLGTTILAAIIYKNIKPESVFLSILWKPLHFIFGKPAPALLTDDTSTMPFEDKYFKEYDEHIATQQQDDVRKECLENMYSSSVRETINDFYGDVIMCYDHATSAFVYYARTANIPYKYLETISRKYMIETNAPSEIHVDIRREYTKAKERRNNPHPATAATAATAILSTDTNTNTNTDNDVFVKLKSYNTAPNLSLHNAVTDRNSTVSTVSTASASSSSTTASASASASSSTASAILREKANRYSYRGKLSEFDEHHKIFLTEKQTTTTHEALHTLREGYADFKKKQMSAL
jgi:hypothetical protein